MAANILSMRPSWLNKHVWTIKRNKAYFGMHMSVTDKTDLAESDRSKIYIFRTKRNAHEFAEILASAKSEGLVPLKIKRNKDIDWNLIETFDMADVMIVREELKSLKRTAKIVNVDLSVVGFEENGHVCKNNIEISIDETKEFLNELMALS